MNAPPLVAEDTAGQKRKTHLLPGAHRTPPVTELASQFMCVTELFVEFERAVAKEDAVGCEALLVEFARFFAIALKHLYVDLCAEHVDTLATASALGTLLVGLGRIEEAEGLLRRVLSGRELALGGEHPRTRAAATNLVLILEAQGAGRAGEAASLRERHSLPAAPAAAESGERGFSG